MTTKPDEADNTIDETATSASVDNSSEDRPPALPPALSSHNPLQDSPSAETQQLDPRINAYRPDLAATDLEGRVSAKKFVDGEWSQIRQTVLPIRSRPDPRASFMTEALFGELVTVYDVQNGWAWVQMARDRYVGYVPVDGLERDISWPTHHIKALGTFVYPEPDIKSAPLSHLSLNSPIAVKASDKRFSELATGGYVITRHIAEESRFARDFVEIAERLIGTPYLWGGSSRLGIDCSGLVQMALLATGVSAPRDSDMQQDALGSTVLIPEDLEGLQRGDLVFWPGHVGIMSDGIMIVHANAHHMSVTVETLPEVASRVARHDGPSITAIKRMSPAA
ncbi:MAG: C40 family peptidase [Pseudomonadota bacterium]